MSAANEIDVIEVDLVEVAEGEVDQQEWERRRKTAYCVKVRTPAGFEAKFRVHPRELVEVLTHHAIRHFTHRGELGAGEYVLEKIVGGTAVPLTPAATLEDSDVGPHAVCALVVAGPQVDG